MKILTVVLIMIITYSCKAQIYPLDTSILDVPNGAYIKDTNNELNQYVGLWKSTWQGKTIYLDLRKIKRKSTDFNGDFVYIDTIYGERKIINANGIVEIDRITNFDEIDPEFVGTYINHIPMDYQTILFFPKNMCNKMANLDVKFLNPQKTEMKMKFRYEPSFLEDNCQYHNLIVNGGDLPINFPQEDVIFTKQ